MPDTKLGAAVAAAQPDQTDQQEQSAPGPDDVVTVKVGGQGKKGGDGKSVTEIERGAAADTHPEGSRFVADQDSPKL